jgi:alpha-glucosidase
MDFSCQGSENQREINIHIGKHDGSYPAWWKEIAVQVNGLSARPSSVTVNGKTATFTYTDTSATIMAKDSGDGIDVVVQSAVHE